jgi:hypothetical protein
MGDEIRITVIATGFERAGIPRRIVEQRPAAARPEPQRSSQNIPMERPTDNVSVNAVPTSSSQAPAAKPPEFKPQTSYQEDLDIPTFLRNRR